MKYIRQIKILLFIFSTILSSSVYADNLGRIFTSAEERQELEKIRHLKEKPKKVKVVEVKPIVEPVPVKKEIIFREPITLKGIVHRSDGKNTAWVNESNTYQGDFDSQSILVPDNEIKPDQVTIHMPEDSSHFELRVGEVFIPEAIEKDIVEPVNTQDN